jgi:hypothetical protein
MSGESNFLSRWSRLKRQSADKRVESPAEGALPGAETSKSPSPTPTQITESHSSAVAELAPEELAQLPRIEDFTAETDLTPFLRNAALRRMWTLDPAIRDGSGDALDYAYDWNMAGGVPGSGPMLPSDDVEAMVRSIMRPSNPGPAAMEAPATEASRIAAQASSVEPQLVSNPPQEPPSAEPPTAEAPPAATPANSSAHKVAEAAKASAGEKGVVAQTHRHGGATPF